MNAQLVERLEKMHRMLAKTHEEVKVLRIEVNTLHQALCTLIPSIFSQYTLPPNCGRLSITRHCLPALCARNAKVAPKRPDPTIK